MLRTVARRSPTPTSISPVNIPRQMFTPINLASQVSSTVPQRVTPVTPVAVRPQAIVPSTAPTSSSLSSIQAQQQLTQDAMKLRNQCQSLVSEAINKGNRMMQKQKMKHDMKMEEMHKQYSAKANTCRQGLEDIQSLFRSQIRSEENVKEIIAKMDRLMKRTDKTIEYVDKNSEGLEQRLADTVQKLHAQVEKMYQENATLRESCGRK